MARRLFLKHRSEEEEEQQDNDGDQSSSGQKFHDKFYRFGDASAMSSYIWDELLDDNNTNFNYDHGNDGCEYQQQQRDPSERFVKWINADNVHRRVQKHQLRALTKRQLYEDPRSSSRSQRNNVITNKNDNDDTKNASITKNQSALVSALPASQATSEWECLTDIGNVVDDLCSVTREGVISPEGLEADNTGNVVNAATPQFGVLS
jgi:hypothetical protein